MPSSDWAATRRHRRGGAGGVGGDGVVLFLDGVGQSSCDGPPVDAWTTATNPHGCGGAARGGDALVAADKPGEGGTAAATTSGVAAAVAASDVPGATG